MIPNFPNIYNIPGLNIPGLNLPGVNQQNKSKWSEINPFRTVEGAGQYGSGLNASAGQLYEHFGKRAGDFGLNPAGKVQGMQEFLDRAKPAISEVLGQIQPPGQFPGRSQAFTDRVNYLMGEYGWDQTKAFRNQTNAIGLGADYDKDGAVSDAEWARYEGKPGAVPPPQQPGNIPGMNGVFNIPQFNFAGQQGPAMPRPQPGNPPPPQVMPQMPPQQQPMTNPQMPPAPQVPQFQPSLFNMQPQMMVNRPRPMGV